MAVRSPAECVFAFLTNVAKMIGLSAWHTRICEQLIRTDVILLSVFNKDGISL